MSSQDYLPFVANLFKAGPFDIERRGGTPKPVAGELDLTEGHAKQPVYPQLVKMSAVCTL